MVDHTAPIKIRRIPIARVIVENPRERSEKTFKQLVDSISKVGLKKPITVTVDRADPDVEAFHLVWPRYRRPRRRSILVACDE